MAEAAPAWAEEAPAWAKGDAAPSWATDTTAPADAKPTIPMPLDLADKLSFARRVLDFVRPNKTMVGSMEGAGSALTGLVAAPVAGIAGLVGSAIPGVSGADVTRNVSQALTYQPKTQEGQDAAGLITLPLDVVQQGIHKVGEKAFDITGSPLVGAGVETGLNAALMFLPVKKILGIGKKPKPGVEPVIKPVAEPIAKAAVESAGEAVKPITDSFPPVERLPAEGTVAKEIAPKTADANTVIAEMRNEIGPDEVGGKLIKDETNLGPDTGERGRTVWLGQRWWFDRPDKISAEQANIAIDKHLAGKKLGVRQQRFIDYMQEEAKFRLEATAGIEGLTPKDQSVASSVADRLIENSPSPADWAKMTEDAKNAHLDDIFGADTSAAAASKKGGEGIISQEAGSTGEKTGRAAQEVTKQPAAELPAPEPAIPIEKDGKIIDVTVVGDVAEPLFKAEVAPDVTRGIAGLAKQFFAENPALRDPTRLISDDIHRYVAGGAVPENMLVAHGLDGAKFADIWRQSITDHARSLGYLSQVMREATAKMTPDELAAFQKAGALAEDAAYIKPFWKHLTDTWRGLLVTQPTTAVRNAITQVGRVGLDVMQTPIDNWIQKLTGKPVTAQPFDGFNELISLFQRNKAATDQILSAFPKQKYRLFQRYLSDVDQSTGIPTQSPVWDAIGRGVDAANILNRTQEYMIRRGIFQSALDVELRNRGLDLTDIIKNNKLGAIPDEAVHTAVEQSLSKTFAETPGWGTWQRKLIDAVNAVPGANIAIPFPRFMYNAIKFQYQYSPMGILSYLSKAEREAFAAGDVSAMSKAMIGTGLLGSAILFRNSDYAGEKWYEAVDGQDNVKDLRPFNPFASYLFAADVMKKMNDGTLYKLTAGDIAQGLLSTNMRAGTGLYLLDNALNLMSKSADEKKFGTKISELTGDFLGGFLTPLSVFRDAYDQITQGQSTARDTRQNPLVDPMKSRIPGVSQTLPEAEIPTRAGPLVTENPLLRQITGVTTHSPKNPLEKELDRLGFDRREVLAATGDKEVDRQYAAHMGVAVEGMLVPVIQTERYQALPDSVQGVFLSEAIGEIRNEVRRSINQTLPPDKQLQIEVKKLSPRVKILLKEFGIGQ